MEEARSKLKPQVDNFGKKIKTQEGKENFVKNTQYSTQEPKGRPVAPPQTGKAFKWTKK